MIRLGYNNLWRILEVYKKAPAECNCIPAGAFCYTSDVRDFNLCRRCAEFREGVKILVSMESKSF